MGPITAIAVVTTDLILFFLMKCKIANGPLEISILVIGFRILLFGFGGNLWFLGYCLLYILLGIVLNIHIANRRFPVPDKPLLKVSKI